MFVVVVVVALLVGGAAYADYSARDTAENLVSGAVASRLDGVTASPKVTIGGGPFLWQLWRGEFDHVQIDIDTAYLNGYELHDLSLTADDVHRSSNTTADEVEAAATLPFTVIADQVAQNSGLNEVTASGAGENLALTTVVLGQEIVLQTALTAAADTVVVHTEKITIGALDVDVTRLPAAAQTLVNDHVITFAELPEGMELSAVTVQSDGVRVHAQGHDFQFPTP